MDENDKKLLNELQNEFPITQRPYKAIAERLKWTEAEVIDRLDGLIRSGTVRKFGAVLAPKKMGYISLLAALAVPDDRVDETASVINAYPGVTHNYLREGEPNIWFTMTEKDTATIECNLNDLEARLGTEIIRLPATRIFKIGVKYDL